MERPYFKKAAAAGVYTGVMMLTLSGGFVAYFCKKQNILGGTVLGLGNTIQAVMALHYFNAAMKSFPHHILSALVCVGSMLIMSFCIQKEREYRLLSLLLPAVLSAVLSVMLKVTGRAI